VMEEMMGMIMIAITTPAASMLYPYIGPVKRPVQEKYVVRMGAT